MECYLQCCTPNGVLFVVYSFKSFGDWSAESSTKWSAKRSAESSRFYRFQLVPSTFKYTDVGQLGHGM